MAVSSMLSSPALSLVILSSLVASLSAFEITFPTSNDYWVACKWNVLKWTYNSTDADIFSVALLNTNETLLNGNYQIANSLATVNGTANLTTNCVEPSEGYYLAFVNASHYSLNKPQVFYTSPLFSIKPNTTKKIDSTDRAMGSITSESSSTPAATTTAQTTNQAANPVSGEKTTHTDAAFKHASGLSVALVCLTAVAAATLLLA